MAAALMYHDVAPAGAEDASGFRGRDAALYKVTPGSFDEHLRAIAAAPRSADFAITFDDGGISAVYAAGLLEQYGLRGYFFVTVDYLGAPGFLAAEDLRELRARGHVVGSHSCSHPLRMAHCPRAQLDDEWARSRAALEAVLGQEVRTASVPGGDFAQVVAESAARAGYATLFTSEPTRRESTVAGLAVRGRFTVQRWTSASTVGALAAGAWLPAARQAIVWNAKKVTKRIAGGGYLHVRRLLLGHSREVRWGDMR